MFFNPRAVALVLAAVISGFTTAFLSLLKSADGVELLVAFSISFSAAFVFVYFAFEFLIFREINKIYSVIEKVKKKDFKISAKKVNYSANPLSKINEEIYTYATKKQQEIDELKKLEVYRREFLADVSHELKTPIHAAQGFVHTLLDGAMEDTEVAERFLTKAAKSLDGLNVLVQDLIALSQMETGETKMHLQDFDILNLAKEVVEQLEGKASKRDIKLKIEPNDKPVWVSADKQRINQVFINLVDNAIKYGEEKGSVEIIFSKEKESISVSVKDDGPGIPPEHLNRIFERFYRIEKSRNKDKGGSGLGLAIVEHIIEAHNSKVSVTSKIGKGTTFSFKLKKGQKQMETV